MALPGWSMRSQQIGARLAILRFRAGRDSDGATRSYVEFLYELGRQS